MNPINERLPTLLPLAIPHLVAPRVIEAAAAYCVGVRGKAVCTTGKLSEMAPLDFKVARCLVWHAEKHSYPVCRSIIYSLELELDAVYGTSSATPPP